MNKKVLALVLIMMLAVLTLFANAQEGDKAAFELAEQGVTSNDEWEPVIQEFDGVEMVLVPAGTFTMGSTDEQLEVAVQQCADVSGDREGCLSIGSREQPAHEQHFDEPFWIDHFEVTNEQYGSVATGTDSFGGRCANFSSEPNQPRNCVTWFEAKEHCESRGGWLPTEREWEYASRGPDSLMYPWGNEFIGENVVYFANSDRRHTSEVGSRPEGVSWVGAMDMSGNLFEWVSTIWAITPDENPEWGDRRTEFEFSYPYNIEDGREDPDRTDTLRILRGGGFFEEQPFFLRPTFRGDNPGHVNAKGFGFRCIRSYED